MSNPNSGWGAAPTEEVGEVASARGDSWRGSGMNCGSQPGRTIGQTRLRACRAIVGADVKKRSSTQFCIRDSFACVGAYQTAPKLSLAAGVSPAKICES